MRDDVAEILGASLSDLILDRAVVLDWRDGPLSGFLRFTVSGIAWRFDLFAERYSQDDLDDRIYVLRAVSAELFSQLWHAIESPGEPNTRIVVPSGEFESVAEREAADSVVDALVRTARPPSLLLRARSLDLVEGIWEIVHVPTDE